MEVLVESLGLHGRKGLSTPGVIDNCDGAEKNARQCKKAQKLETGESGEDDDEPEEDVAVDLAMDVGDCVEVAGHGRGRVSGKGCCGFKGSYEVTYDDGTRYHCNPVSVSKASGPTGGMIKCQGCSAWHVDGIGCLYCEDDVEAADVGEVGSRCMLEEAGSQHIGGDQWMIHLKGAKKFPDVPIPGMTRRVTRDMNNGRLVEDLWITKSTPVRLLKREFKAAMDVEVRVHVETDKVEVEIPWGDRELPPDDATLYRAAAARLKYVALDRPDAVHSAKESSRRMSKPTNKDWEMINRLTRYLMQVPRIVQVYEF